MGIDGHKINRIFKWYSDRSLATKLMIAIYSGILVILVFITVLMFFLSYSNNTADKKEQGRESLDGALNLFREEMQYLSGMADFIGLSKDIHSLMIESNTPDKADDTGARMEILSEISTLRYAVSIVLYDINGHVLDYISIDGSENPYDQPPDDPNTPFGRIKSDQRTFEWQYIDAGSSFMQTDNSPKMCLWKRVLSSRDRSIIGVIAISVDIRKFVYAGNEIERVNSTLMLLTDGGAEVFNRMGISLDQKRIHMMNGLDPASDSRVDFDGANYWVMPARVVNTDLKMFYFLSENDIGWDINSFAAFTIVSMILFMLLLIPLFLFVTKSVTKPLKKLTTYMENFAHGDFASRVTFRHRDEVGRLGGVFNLMVTENKRLIDSNYVLKLREKEAELAFLQGQINPHFLYNAVNSIQWLALKNKDKEVADLIFSLGKIFQSRLGAKHKMSTVRQEIELLYNYLKLQKQCYGNRFDYNIDIENGVGEFYIPRLSIQPLVENTVIHGVDKSEEKVRITVGVHLVEDTDMLRITVSDNGPGILPERLAMLRRSLAVKLNEEPGDTAGADGTAVAGAGAGAGTGAGAGVGVGGAADGAADGTANSGGSGSRLALKNISDRLRITYDGNYEFNIDSVSYEKTTIELIIPVMRTDA